MNMGSSLRPDPAGSAAAGVSNRTAFGLAASGGGSGGSAAGSTGGGFGKICKAILGQPVAGGLGAAASAAARSLLARFRASNNRLMAPFLPAAK